MSDIAWPPVEVQNEVLEKLASEFVGTNFYRVDIETGFGTEHFFPYSQVKVENGVVSFSCFDGHTRIYGPSEIVRMRSMIVFGHIADSPGFDNDRHKLEWFD